MGTVGTILGDPEAVGRDDAHPELKTTEVSSAISRVVFWVSSQPFVFVITFYHLRCGKLKIMMMMTMMMIMVMMINSCNSVAI